MLASNDNASTRFGSVPSSVAFGALIFVIGTTSVTLPSVVAMPIIGTILAAYFAMRARRPTLETAGSVYPAVSLPASGTSLPELGIALPAVGEALPGVADSVPAKSANHRKGTPLPRHVLKPRRTGTAPIALEPKRTAAPWSPRPTVMLVVEGRAGSMPPFFMSSSGEHGCPLVFLATRTTTRHGSRVTARELSLAYRSWCRENGTFPVTSEQLGAACSRLGWDRGKSNCIFYRDRVLISVDRSSSTTTSEASPMLVEVMKVAA